MATSAAASEAEPSDRTLSWLDEDDPGRDNEPFISMEPLPLPPALEPPPPPPPPVQPGPRRRNRKLLAVVVGLVAVVVGAAVVAAGTAYRLVFEDRPAGPAAVAGTGRTVSAPIGKRTEAQFDLVTGTTTVNLRSADLGGDLYRISTAEGSDVLPRPVHEGDQVNLHLVQSGESGPGAVDIQLSSRVTWKLRLTGGAATHVVDMGGGRLTGLDLIGGAARAELTLPARPARCRSG
ncbi:hypothetical protein [Phytohabitans rumicis]|uniref:Uncharacterized protein n=1 Tax=Phytohabitans rumicis TaxID=1076125 RepID=A0A6V8L5L5_9ACTN|nr:hypothetical protein [Phytohabitans rumicis]GFJ92543.1 hypothetical protein Prum_061850 [Phytohabitans rumicis]